MGCRSRFMRKWFVSESATCPTCSGRLGGPYKNRCYTCKPCIKKKTGQTIPCASCGEPFYVARSRLKIAKYCSFECSGVGRRKGAAAPAGFKQCLKCREVKPLESFASASAKWDGKHIWCRVCTSTARDVITVEQDRRRHDQHLKRKYGISLADYEAMAERQGGVCAICGGPPEKRSKLMRERFDVDHCHATGRVRGLLCLGCNTGIGHLGDDPARIRAALEYLAQHT